MLRKRKLNDLWYQVTNNYNRAVETGRQVFRDNARKYYKEYKARGGKRKYPTKYTG